MEKTQQTPDQIVNALNDEMAGSDALDGDCRECKVRHIGRVPDQEAEQLGRNWDVGMVNGECHGGCMEVLEQIVRKIGSQYDADWS